MTLILATFHVGLLFTQVAEAFLVGVCVGVCMDSLMGKSPPASSLSANLTVTASQQGKEALKRSSRKRGIMEADGGVLLPASLVTDLISGRKYTPGI